MKVSTNIKVGTGLGDTIEDIIHISGLDRFAKLYTQLTGNDCCCQKRKEALNRIQLFPIKKPS
jgi:hypothetical protein